MDKQQPRETRTVSRVTFGNIVSSPSESRIHAENKRIIDLYSSRIKGWYLGFFFGRK